MVQEFRLRSRSVDAAPALAGIDVLVALRRTPASVLFLGPDLVVRDATDAFLADTMTVREEIVGRPVFEVFPDDPDRGDVDAGLRASLRRVLATGRPDAMAVQRCDVGPGHGAPSFVRYWSRVNTPLVDDDGTVVLVYHQIVDVTDLVLARESRDASEHEVRTLRDRTTAMEAEIVARAQDLERVNERLRSHEERFLLLSQATSDAVWDWDLRRDRVRWNEGFRRLFGYDPDDLPPTSASWYEHIHPEDREWVLEGIHAAIAGGERSWAAQYRYMHRSGAVVWVVDRGLVIRDDDGTAIRMVGGMTDVTERVVAERALREQAALLDLTRDAILVRDLDHRVTYWNQGAERLYGWSRSEAIGRSIRDLLYDDPSEFDRLHTLTLADGEVRAQVSQRTRSGAPIVVDARWTVICDAAGEPRAVFAINSDVTAHKQIEERLLRAQRLESIGTLAGGIAHDLNNVLAPVLMSADLLLVGERDPERRSIIESIASSATRGAEMINRILSFARGTRPRESQVPIATLLADVARIVSETFPRSIALEVGPAPTDLAVAGDPTQLHQVLLNLCVNARDAMPDGGRLTIAAEEISGEGQGSKPATRCVLVRVEDSGSGIEPHVLPRIFDPFFTTKAPGEGTGLGLATALAIVQGHGGEIRVHSQPGAGTTVDVVLPAQRAASEPTGPVPGALRRGRGELVLVVDDEALVRDLAQRTLESFGYSVVTANNGAEAVAIVSERHDIDLVLTDVLMPVMGGVTAIHTIRDLRPDLPVIAVSGLAPDSARDAIDDAVVEFIAKPYAARTLLAAVEAALNASRGRSAE